jgi:cobalt-precorrin 5A hydrolase
MGEAMIFAGIGCRKGAAAAAVEAAIMAALAARGLDADTLTAVATSSNKAEELGIKAAAAALGVPFVTIAQLELEAAGHRIATKSQRVLSLTGVGSVAEAAALAAAGTGARLLAQRVVVGAVTCALAQSRIAPMMVP